MFSTSLQRLGLMFSQRFKDVICPLGKQIEYVTNYNINYLAILNIPLIKRGKLLDLKKLDKKSCTISVMNEIAHL